MSDEKEPLLKNLDEPSTSYNEDDDAGLKLSIFKSKTYGTYSGSSVTIPISDRAFYAWSELNVFTKDDSSSNNFLKKYNQNTRQQKKHILKDVFGFARSGELLAILGSSGSGKTTLLNALTFRSTRNTSVSGLRSFNGIPVTANSLTSQLAYVQQDDLFIGSLTVKEHLIFQALVRMDKDISYDKRIKRVEEVILQLTLSKCENTRIGIPGRIKGISGGERKRLSFAAEVLTNPTLMFCDEPTSGLDSFMALNVIQVLKSLVQLGKIVVCTIHQPSSELYTMFDKILLMAEGRVAFLGTPEEANTFFTELEAPCPRNYNPADHFIQLLAIVPEHEKSCMQAIEMICEKFKKCDLGIKTAEEAFSVATIESGYDLTKSEEFYRSPYKVSWFSQFRALLWRSWISVMKEPLLIKVRVLQTAMVALLIGAIYYGQHLNQNGVMNINGALFIFLTNMTFQNVFAVINVFCSELPVFLREHRNGMYRTDVYFICKTLAEMPLFTFIPTFFTCICYFLIGLNSEQPRFIITCGIVTLVANVATSFGYMISCVSNSVSMALSIGPPVIIPFLLFGGFFLNISSIPFYFKWLSYLSWFRFGNEALLINQWKNVTNIVCTNLDSTCLDNGHVVLEIYNFLEDNFMGDLLGLFLLICAFRILAYIALLLKTLKLE